MRWTVLAHRTLDQLANIRWYSAYDQLTDVHRGGCKYENEQLPANHVRLDLYTWPTDGHTELNHQLDSHLFARMSYIWRYELWAGLELELHEPGEYLACWKLTLIRVHKSIMIGVKWIVTDTDSYLWIKRA